MSDTSGTPEITDDERETVEGLANLYKERRAATELELQEMRKRGELEIDLSPVSADESKQAMGDEQPELPAGEPALTANQDPD